MHIYIDSWRCRTLADLIEAQSYADGICVNLSVMEHLTTNSMIRTEDITGNRYTTLTDLQEVADIYCAGLDVVNY
jgi:hypothetical protein